ncbi:MAG: hypothetical protein SOR72_04445 [Hornefia sp.]|nr:hypothetical protein [Hornefia sp.]
MNKVRKEFRLSKEIMDNMDEVKKEKGFTTDSETLSFLISSYHQRKEITEDIVKEMEKRWKKTFDRIRLAAQSSEKYSYTILDAINTLLYEYGSVQVLYPAHGHTTHKIVKESKDNLQEIIENRKQVKDNNAFVEKQEAALEEKEIYIV